MLSMDWASSAHRLRSSRSTCATRSATWRATLAGRFWQGEDAVLCPGPVYGPLLGSDRYPSCCQPAVSARQSWRKPARGRARSPTRGRAETGSRRSPRATCARRTQELRASRARRCGCRPSGFRPQAARLPAARRAEARSVACSARGASCFVGSLLQIVPESGRMQRRTREPLERYPHLMRYEKHRQRCGLPGGCRLDARHRVGISAPWSFRISVRTSGLRWSLC
jgi:hypothetical protein